MPPKKDPNSTLVSLIEGLHTKFDGFREDLKGIQRQVNVMEAEQSSLRTRVAVLESDNTRQASSTGEAKLQEEIEKLKRQANIILFGVEETQDGMDLALELLRLLLPAHTGDFEMRSIGKVREEVTRPRPIKVFLNGLSERNIALRNKCLLKDRENFSKINVKADETLLQRENRARPIPDGETRISRKRSRQGRDGVSQQAKIPRTANSVSATSVDFSFTNDTSQQMDSINDGDFQLPNPGTASAVTQDPGAQSQSIVVSQEGGADGSGDEAGSQQVFYVMEDGALLDPQSLGLSLEQLQQLLNQA